MMADFVISTKLKFNCEPLQLLQRLKTLQPLKKILQGFNSTTATMLRYLVPGEKRTYAGCYFMFPFILIVGHSWSVLC